MKKLMLVLATIMVTGLTACGSSDPADNNSTSTQAEGATGTDSGASSEAGTDTAAAEPVAGGTFRSVEGFPYASLDVHKDYYSWHTQFYGISESLFRIEDDLSISPWLAEGYETDGNTMTITLKDGVCFSNGETLTADMVKRNLERIAEVNTRFTYIADWTIETPDEKTIVITTPEIYPTLINDLATAEIGMMDLDNTTDFDNNPICTGPFVVEEFIPEGDTTVTRNENYWGGEVLLDGAVFYAMGDEESKMLAMQNGEIDGYVDISPASREVYEAEPDRYYITSVNTERRAMALYNSARLSDNLRAALVIGLNRESLASYTNGILAYSEGFFTSGTYYGGVQSSPEYDVEAAKALIEADGYTMNESTGFYEKDGQTLSLTISTYAKRSLDTLAILMQEQFKALGIDAQIKIEDNPESTYLSTMDFDVGLYTAITDKAGEPFTFLNQIKKGEWLDVCGFGNDETDVLIEELRYETDEDKKSELADQIMTQFYESNCYVSIGQYIKTTAIRTGAGGLGETNPLQFYAISAESYAN